MVLLGIDLREFGFGMFFCYDEDFIFVLLHLFEELLFPLLEGVFLLEFHPFLIDVIKKL